MSLATYDEARPWAKAIKEEMLEKRMPPWHAVKGYGAFRNAPSLTQREIDLIVNWVEGGAPKGDDKGIPPGPLYSDDWQLGNPDLVLKPQSESEVAADADQIRTFVLATSFKEDRWLRAIDLRPGIGSVIHCATLYAVKGEHGKLKDEMEAERATSSLSPQASSFLLGTWIPGQRTVALPDGVAQLLPAGASVAAKIHYRGSGEATKDLSTIGLYFAKTPVKQQLRPLAISDSDAQIPAGAAAHRVIASVTIQESGEAVAILPAVNALLVSLQATAYRPDGTEEVLIWTRGYQFDWQPTYFFKKPVSLPKGTRIEVIAYLDNSEGNQSNPNNPPKRVRWSDLSGNPMCTLMIATNRTNGD